MKMPKMTKAQIKYFREQGKKGGEAGGKKGGDARSAALTPERRREIASKAAKARWAKATKKTAKKGK